MRRCDHRSLQVFFHIYFDHEFWFIPFQMSSYPTRYRSPPRTTEFDILKAAHRFLREDSTTTQDDSTWDDKLAQKYEASLYREFAVCDLKHYKTGNVNMLMRNLNEADADNISCSSSYAGERKTKCSLDQARLHAGILVVCIIRLHRERKINAIIKAHR